MEKERERGRRNARDRVRSVERKRQEWKTNKDGERTEKKKLKKKDEQGEDEQGEDHTEEDEDEVDWLIHEASGGGSYPCESAKTQIVKGSNASP